MRGTLRVEARPRGHRTYLASNRSGFDDPRDTSTVRKYPGDLGRYACSSRPWYVPSGVSLVNTSGATMVCSSVEPAVACAYDLSKTPKESCQSTVRVRQTTTRSLPPS